MRFSCKGRALCSSRCATLYGSCRSRRDSAWFAICSLALGIGATSAQFSIADALLMRPLPVLEPSRIAAVTTTSSAAFGANAALSYPDYRDYRDGNRTFAGLIASGFTSFGFSREAIALPRITFGLFVSSNFFRVLGVQPALGRVFSNPKTRLWGGIQWSSWVTTSGNGSSGKAPRS